MRIGIRRPGPDSIWMKEINQFLCIERVPGCRLAVNQRANFMFGALLRINGWLHDA